MADLVFLYPDTLVKENYLDHTPQKGKISERDKNMDWIQIIIRDKGAVGVGALWLLIDGSPRRETLRSAWKRDARRAEPSIIKPINGDAHGNVTETPKRDNESRKSCKKNQQSPWNNLYKLQFGRLVRRTTVMRLLDA